VNRLPLTVIGGYLGAGKTTLVNHLLQSGHGKRLMVMVNDFGAVNVDAALIAAQGADTLELTNGCVCCTMGADLFMAVGDVLDRADRPDHLIIEASGVADPAKIAEVARNEPDLSYAGIVTVVDALNFASLQGDEQVSAQIEAQVSVADLIYVSKAEGVVPPDLATRLAALGAVRILAQASEIERLLWDLAPELPDIARGHAQFARWQAEAKDGLDRERLKAAMMARPVGLYRIKGFISLDNFGMAEVQVVGKSVEITRSDYAGAPVLVGIGPEGQMDLAAVNMWWAAV
jgi:G3E family GTPase